MNTYNDLWWDREFVEKRIQEQKDYINQERFKYNIWNKITEEDIEKMETAAHVLARFERQLKEIKKLKGHCCRY